MCEDKNRVNDMGCYKALSNEIKAAKQSGKQAQRNLANALNRLSNREITWTQYDDNTKALRKLAKLQSEARAYCIAAAFYRGKAFLDVETVFYVWNEKSRQVDRHIGKGVRVRPRNTDDLLNMRNRQFYAIEESKQFISSDELSRFEEWVSMSSLVD